MVKQEQRLAKRAKDYWERRDLSALENLQKQDGAGKVPEVLYFVGLALNALNKRREAIRCWRQATELDPRNEDATRTLAYELLEQAPVDAAELFYRLVGSQRANADDFTCLGEICLKQDRLKEAYRWLEQARRLEPENSLALLALATLYAQVGDASFALDFLQKAADTEELDLSDLASDAEFELLWGNPRFENIVARNGSRSGSRSGTGIKYQSRMSSGSHESEV
jgi:tetratricopeptide (TPR) repeat protein